MQYTDDKHNKHDAFITYLLHIGHIKLTEAHEVDISHVEHTYTIDNGRYTQHEGNTVNSSRDGE